MIWRSLVQLYSCIVSVWVPGRSSGPGWAEEACWAQSSSWCRCNSTLSNRLRNSTCNLEALISTNKLHILQTSRRAFKLSNQEKDKNIKGAAATGFTLTCSIPSAVSVKHSKKIQETCFFTHRVNINFNRSGAGSKNIDQCDNLM